MHRYLLIACCMLVLLSGCGNRNKKEEESMKNYETFVNAVINNKGIESKSIPFDYNLLHKKQEDGSYEYEVRISNPRVAMYDIQAIAVNQDLDSNTNVYPCLGILGDDVEHTYQMVPFQANPSMNYWQGIGLNGISQEKQFTLNVMVTWKDASRANKYSVFFNCSYAEETTVEEDTNNQ